MFSISFILLTLLFRTIKQSNGEPLVPEITCNLASDTNDSSFICKITHPLTPLRFIISPQSPNNGPTTHLDIDPSNSHLVWLNKYQPTWTRWSELCAPAASAISSNLGASLPLLQQQQHLFKQRSSPCLNEHECDLTGVCKLKLQAKKANEEEEFVILNLVDTLNRLTEQPKFPIDMRLLNVTVDLDGGVEGGNGMGMGGNFVEVVLLERTDKLDVWRSKPNRDAVEFRLEKPSEQLMTNLMPENNQNNCKIFNDGGSVVFGLRHDKQAEKLYLTISNRKFQELKKGLYKKEKTNLS